MKFLGKKSTYTQRKKVTFQYLKGKAELLIYYLLSKGELGLYIAVFLNAAKNRSSIGLLELSW